MDGYSVVWPRQPVDDDNVLTDGEVFNLVEFSYEYVAEALNPVFHSYGGHSHFEYDQEAGQDKFAVDVNRIFERNGAAFQLADGEVTHTLGVRPELVDAMRRKVEEARRREREDERERER